MASEKRPACEGCDPIGIAEVADILGLSEPYARNLAARNGLPVGPFKRLGVTRRGAWLWWRHEVEAAAQERRG